MVGGTSSTKQCDSGGHAPQLTGYVFPALVPHCMCDIDNDECSKDRFSQHYCNAHRVLEHSWIPWLTAIAVILFCRLKMALDGTLLQAYICFPQNSHRAPGRLLP